jgi:hypothetical protein
VTSSGAYTFNPAADDLLNEAWERLGKTPAEISGDVARAARRSLQYMLIDWTNRGVNLWQIDSATVTMNAGTNAYTMPIGTADVLEITVSVGGVDRLLAPIGRSDYVAIPVKTTQSVPTQYWVERTNPYPIVHIYPTPDASYTATYWRLRQPQDIGLLANTPDAPVLWGDALAAGLAARLAVKYAPDRVAVLKADAAEALMNARGENRDRVPLRISLVRGR